MNSRKRRSITREILRCLDELQYLDQELTMISRRAWINGLNEDKMDYVLVKRNREVLKHIHFGTSQAEYFLLGEKAWKKPSAKRLDAIKEAAGELKEIELDQPLFEEFELEDKPMSRINDSHKVVSRLAVLVDTIYKDAEYINRAKKAFE